MKIKLRSVTICLLFIGVSSSALAQKTKVYFGLGGMYNSFQDSRFSDVQFSTATVLPEVGFSRVDDKNYWYANAYFYYYKYNFPNHDTIAYNNLAYNVSFGYLRNLKPSLYLGLTWDVLDYYKRQTEFLGNGADAYKLSSDFYISGKYLWNLSKDWQFNFGLDYALLSFINTEPSFTANYQQNLVDNGEVNSFIDSDTKAPFKLQDMELKPLWEQFNIRTLIELNYKRRLSLYYSWNFRTYSDNKGYPITDARQILTLRINLINHLKK